MNGLTKEPLQAFTPAGEHLRFPVLLDGATINTGRMFHMTWGHIWVVTPQNGLFIYDYNGTLKDTTDDRYMFLNSGVETGNLPDNEVYCAVEDYDGHVWVGTRVGMRVFYNARNAFNSSNFNAQDVYIQEGIYTQILMENENVAWIAVDGANQKWMATRGSGAFQISADGSEELAHFTVENSPIYSDYLNSLVIDGSSGEVLFATDKGLIGYRGEATTGNSNYSQVQVFPNPVKSDYTGNIGISGLMPDSEIRITDVSGNLVMKATSQGGSYSWDGKNYDGNRVHTGVYLVFASSEDGSEKMVTKILFLN
ncbi:T9SS type A sorting domain-containing protein [bacterium SCSIO 12741]|nr:T9SS type A sorting domain-containing protein [bacterium SCSIO 12741]